MADDLTKRALIDIDANTSGAEAGINDLNKNLNKLGNVSLDTPFKSLKSQIKESTVEAQRLGQAFGHNSEEFRNAAARVAELKDQLGETNAHLASFNADNKLAGLQTTARAAQGTVSGLGGALTLVSGQSEKAGEAAARLGGLLSFAGVLSSLDDLKDGFKSFGNAIQTTTVFQKLNAVATSVTAGVYRLLGIAAVESSAGFNVLKVAIIGTGIGALVIGVIALITHFKQIKEAVENLIPGLASVGKFFGSLVDAFTDFVGITTAAGRALDDLADKAEERSKKQQEILDSEGYKYDKFTQDKIKANIDYQKHIVEVNKAEGKTTEEKYALLKQYALKYNHELDDIDKARADKIKEDSDKAAKEAKAKQDELAKKRKEAADKEKALNDAKLAEQKVTDKAVEDANIAAIKDETTKKIVQLGVQQQAEVDAAIVAKGKKLISDEDYATRRKAIDAKYEIEKQAIVDAAAKVASDKAIEQAKKDAELEYEIDKDIEDAKIAAAQAKVTSADANVIKTTRENTVVTREDKLPGENVDTPESAAQKIDAIAEAQRLAEDANFQLEFVQAQGNQAQIESLTQQHETNLADITRNASKTKLDLKKKEVEGQIALIGGIGTATSALSSVLKKDSAAQKAVAISSALINTYLGIAAGVKLGYPAAIPAVIAAAATGFGAVANIVKTPAGDGSTGGGSVPSVPSAASLAPQVSASETQPQNIQDVRVTSAPAQNLRAYLVTDDLDTHAKQTAFNNQLSTF